MKIKLAFISLNAKMILKIIPDRLVAGRKILTLLTVVRIHLREFFIGKNRGSKDENHHKAEPCLVRARVSGGWRVFAKR